MPEHLTRYVEIGDTLTASKTLTETDLAMFCAISGDFDPIHVDEEYAKATVFGQRIAHGILSMALLSTVAAKMSANAKERGFTGTSVSMGFDKLRFLRPVFVGNTLTARYQVEEIDVERSRSLAKATVSNQADDTCVAARHVMRWLAP